jgi:hypothetical protein
MDEQPQRFSLFFMTGRRCFVFFFVLSVSCCFCLFCPTHFARHWAHFAALRLSQKKREYKRTNVCSLVYMRKCLIFYPLANKHKREERKKKRLSHHKEAERVVQQSIATEKEKKKIVSKDAHADAENCAVSLFLLRLFQHFRPSTCKITSKCKRRDDERRRSFSFYILWQQQPDGNSSIFLCFIFTIECDNHLSRPAQTEEIPSSEVAAEKASSYIHTHRQKKQSIMFYTYKFPVVVSWCVSLSFKVYLWTLHHSIYPLFKLLNINF